MGWKALAHWMPGSWVQPCWQGKAEFSVWMLCLASASACCPWFRHPGRQLPVKEPKTLGIGGYKTSGGMAASERRQGSSGCHKSPLMLPGSGWLSAAGLGRNRCDSLGMWCLRKTVWRFCSLRPICSLENGNWHHFWVHVANILALSCLSFSCLSLPCFPFAVFLLYHSIPYCKWKKNISNGKILQMAAFRVSPNHYI